MPLSYKKTKPTKKYDNIIIGSGISGIALAAILAKESKSSLVLERHYTAGGFTHVFKRRGYEWDVGVHYIGQAHRENSLVRKLFEYVAGERLQWAELPEIYDKIIFGEKAYNFHKGREQFKEKLKEQFHNPEDQESIDAYIELVRKAARSSSYLYARRAVPRWINQYFGKFIARKSFPYYSRTTREVLESITSNQELIGVLTGQFGDYGMPPGESSFIMHANLVHHYFNGGSYPVGGSAAIFDSIEPTITAAGGDVFVNAEVDEIIVKNEKASGVKMKDGKAFYAKNIVSSAGVHVTYNHLLKEKSHVDKAEINAVKASVSHLCLYVGLQHTPEELKLSGTNLWVYPDNYDHDENVKCFLEDPENAEFPVVYISFPAAKDPDFQNRFPGKSTIEVITLADYSLFTKWQSEAWKKRGKDYESLKEKFSQRLLKKLYEQLPQLRGKVDYYELSSPLSTRHFMNYEKGEIYGLEHSPARFANRAIHAKTPIKNLYLTGQDIVSCGIAGALVSAVLTCRVMTGKNLFRKIVKS